MKREILFEGVRDESGDLCLVICDTDVAAYLGKKFWELIIDHFGPTEMEQFGPDERRVVKDKMDIMRKALEDNDK